MTPLYFRFTSTYPAGHLINLRIEAKENDLIKYGEREWISFAGYSHEVNGVPKNYLYIFIQVAQESETINFLFDHRLSLDEDQRKKLTEIARPIDNDLSSKSQQAVRQFRWLTGLNFDANIKGEYVPLEWSRDRKYWEIVPMNSAEPNIVVTGFGGYEPIQNVDKVFLRELIAPNIDLSEPLGHDLLYEAKRLYDNGDFRGAFLLGFSALEVGVKEFISGKIPKATWLMTYSPSPNVLDICLKYLPTLDERLKIEKNA